MSFRLRFDGIDDLVTLPSACSVNWGTGAYTIEIGMVATRFPATGNEYFLGSAGATATGIALRQASGDGALAVVVGGTHRFSSSAGLVILNEYHVYRLEHDASASGGQWRWYRDGVLFGSTGNFTTTTVATIGVFGRGSSGSICVPFDLGHVELTGFTNSQKWDADLSGGTGLILPTVSGTNQGTLVNFPTLDEEWIFVGGGGGAVELSASLSSANTLSASLRVRHLLSASLSSGSTLSASLTVASGGRIFAIDVTGIPDGNYPVAIFNHTTGDFITRQTLAFAGGQAQYATTLTLGTDFSGYVISAGGSPANGAVIYGQVSNAP